MATGDPEIYEGEPDYDRPQASVEGFQDDLEEVEDENGSADSSVVSDS